MHPYTVVKLVQWQSARSQTTQKNEHPRVPSTLLTNPPPHSSKKPPKLSLYTAPRYSHSALSAHHFLTHIANLHRPPSVDDLNPHMASACVNNAPIPLFSSPRLSFTRDTGSDPDPLTVISPDPDPKDFIDFEFHLNDPVSIIPADELFSNGKLVPLQLSPVKMPDPDPDQTTKPQHPPETPRKQPVIIGPGSDHFAVSPKAPTCSSRWRELLHRKRQQQQQHHQPTPKKSDPNPNPKSIKHFLNRNARSGSESLPLLKDSEPEPPPAAASISTRHSVSGPEPDIDPENKPNQNPILLNRNPPKHRVRSAPARKPAEPVAAADSPRMNASGKVVFQGLGRSASSPSTCGARAKSYRGMERSYSANVRVTPVLNVPVCSLRGGSKGFGFGQLFSGSGSNPKGGNGNGKG